MFRRRDTTEALKFLGRDISILSAICERNEVLLLSLVLQFLEDNNRLSTINDGDHMLLQRGQTPLWNASHCGSLEAATLLIEKGADLNKPDENGWTPLHAACSAGHDAVVKLFLAKGADKNLLSVHGTSPIEIACNNGWERILLTLLVYKADFGFTDNGRLPIDLANFQGNHGCVKIFREWLVKSNQETVKLCVSRLKREGVYEVVNAVSMNHLSREMFVFNVLEEMMSRQMYGLAEKVVAYVGTGEPMPPLEEEQTEESAQRSIDEAQFESGVYDSLDYHAAIGY